MLSASKSSSSSQSFFENLTVVFKVLSLSPSRSRARAVCRIRQDTAKAKLVVILLVKNRCTFWELSLHSRSLGKGGRVVRLLKRGKEGTKVLGEDGKRILGQITRSGHNHNRRLLASIKAG